jgi:prolyl-tRNA synthetase
MRQRTLFGKTVKEAPKDATAVSHKLLSQAGFIYQTAAGIYSFLPLGYRVLQKIDRIIKEEFEKRSVQHMFMPIIHPTHLWEETGRIDIMKDIIARFQSKAGQELLIAPTHEETVCDIARRYINSYKDLPFIVNQNQLKFRDETRVQGGILRTREFYMQDAYSFHADNESLQEGYELMKEAYCAVFEKIGIEYMVVKADTGAIGGSASEEFMAPADVGEDKLIICEKCEYKANLEKADSLYVQVDQDKEEKELEKVLGKGIIGVEALAEFLKIPVEQTSKTIIFETDKGVIAAMIRGDYDINEAKFKSELGLNEVRLASANTIKELTGAEVGYAGPVGLPDSIRLIADHSCKGRTNFECGGNETDYHLTNVNFERDFSIPEFFDIRSVKEGETCVSCKNGKLKSINGIEIGHIFQLGTRYTESMDINFVDESGKKQLVIMGTYGIGISRVIGATVEQVHDENGLKWPKNIAPFQVHLLALGTDKDEEMNKKAEELYSSLLKEGVEVLYDDRSISPGKKFADSDLIGIPVRLTLSKRSLENGGLEWKERDNEQAEIISESDILKKIQEYYSS